MTHEEAIAFDDARQDAERSRRGWVRIEPSRTVPDGFDLKRGLPGEIVTMTVSRAELAELAAKATNAIATS